MSATRSITIDYSEAIDGVVLEPWGEVHVLAYGESLVVRCKGTASTEISVSVEREGEFLFVKLWAPTGGVLEAETDSG